MPPSPLCLVAAVQANVRQTLIARQTLIQPCVLDVLARPREVDAVLQRVGHGSVHINPPRTRTGGVSVGLSAIFHTSRRAASKINTREADLQPVSPRFPPRDHLFLADATGFRRQQVDGRRLADIDLLPCSRVRVPARAWSAA